MKSICLKFSGQSWEIFLRDSSSRNHLQILYIQKFPNLIYALQGCLLLP